ncbi:MAG: hypothetical protein M3Q33_13375 [Acidobacteriota bacterium]|nr:hypothetical protein [Acidobacteriota bacterium]
MKLLCLAVFFAFSSFIFPITAQEKPISEAADKVRLELKQKAFALAEEVLLETPTLDSKENQIVILTLATDLFWSSDEKRARQLAQETAAKIRSELVPLLEKEEEIRSHLLYSPRRFGNLRRDFLLMIVQHDAVFAQELAAFTRPLLLTLSPANQSEQTQLRNWNNDERDLEQGMAFQIAAKNVGEARKLARKSLSRGVSKESLNLLRRLQIKDADSANGFANELIQKLLEADFAKDDEAYETTGVFLQQFDEKQGVFARPCNCAFKPLITDSKKIRKLASKWLDYVLTVKDDKASFYFLPAMSVLSKLLPERTVAIQNKFSSIKKNEPKRVENEQLTEKFFDDKTSPETIAALALKKPDGERFYFYRQAFIKAANNSKAALEKLLESISTHPEGEDKNWLLDQIAANLSGKTAEDGNLDAALEMAQRVVKRDRRLGLLSFLALEYLEKGEMEKAKQISDEISVLFDLKTKDKMPKAIVSYDVFSSLFRTFALIDTERAFTLLEAVLPEATETLSGRFPVSNVDETIDLRNLLIRNAYILTLYSKPIIKLADTDFDRTQRLTAYFTKPELRVLVNLLIAQAVLQGKIEVGKFADRNEMIIIKD